MFEKMQCSKTDWSELSAISFADWYKNLFCQVFLSYSRLRVGSTFHCLYESSARVTYHTLFITVTCFFVSHLAITLFALSCIVLCTRHIYCRSQTPLTVWLFWKLCPSAYPDYFCSWYWYS